MITTYLLQKDSLVGGIVNGQARNRGLALCVVVIDLLAGNRQSARLLGPLSRCQIEESSRKGETGFWIGWLLCRKFQRQRVSAVVSLSFLYSVNRLASLTEPI